MGILNTMGVIETVKMGINCRNQKQKLNGQYGKHVKNELSEVKVWTKV